MMKKYIVLLLTFTLLSCSPVSKYRDSPEVLSWEKDIAAFEQLDRTEIYPSSSILFAGSSSIRLWSSLPSDMAPYDVIQRGYGGAMLSDFAVYINRIVAPHPCRAIVLFIANDITGSKGDKSPREVASLFRYTLKVIRKSHPDTPVFWIAVTPTQSRWTVWEKIQDANRRISDLCAGNPNTFFIRTDFAFLMKDGKPDTSLFIEDQLHLNGKGYAIWTTIIKKELDTVLNAGKK
jgi:lysophospholipase L1-like esterase